MKLPSPKEFKNALALNSKQKAFIERARLKVELILNKESPKFLLIVGPCSIHDPLSALEYAKHLYQLQQEVSKSFFLVMRAHFEKPRTSHGWKGYLYDPDLTGENNLQKGLEETRKILLELATMEVPVATEFLHPLSPLYLEDLITYGSIGARTSTSQIHRTLASGLTLPMGLKNSTDGSIENAVKACLVATSPQTCFGMNEEGFPVVLKTQGNPLSHIVLRGGEGGPNYQTESLELASQLLKEASLPVRMLVDCAHDNSRKNQERQPAVFRSIITERLQGNSSLVGAMMESHINAGNQPPGPLKELNYGISITDPCLSFADTRECLLWAQERIFGHVAAIS